MLSDIYFYHAESARQGSLALAGWLACLQLLTLAGGHEHKAASAVGILRLTRLEARLAQRCRLLIPERASDRHASEGAASQLAVDLRVRDDLRQHPHRYLESIARLLVPAAASQVHQHRPRRVGDIAHMQSTLDSTAQVPDQP